MTDSIRLEGVTFGYPGKTVFTDLTLSIPDRQFCVLVGPNGGGKTTLLKLLLGFTTPQSGVVSVYEEPPGRGQPVGYVPQDVTATAALPISLSSVVLMGRLNPRAARWTREDREAADEALELVGLQDLSRWPFGELSIGQRQRGLIARALASRPRLMLLDEPLASVDPAGRRLVMECLKKASRQATVVMVSHDLETVPDCAGQILFVDSGVTAYSPSDFPAGYSRLFARQVETPPANRKDSL